MNQRKKFYFISAFVLTVTLCYSVDWAPYYIYLSAGDSLQFLPSIRTFRNECTKPDKPHMKCTDSFVIPRANISSVEAIGLGIFLSGTEIYCSENPSNKIVFGDINNASRALELLRTYQTADLQLLRCNDSLVLDVWGSKSYKRSGYVGGHLIIGRSNYIDLAKRITEFFLKDLYVVLAFGLLAIILTSNLIIKPLAGNNITVNAFDTFSVYWLIYALLKSGIPELLMPLLANTNYYIRISNFVSTLAHLGPVLFILAFENSSYYRLRFACGVALNGNHFLKISNLALITGIIVASPFFGKWLGIMSATASVLYFVSARERKRPELFLFGLCQTIETAKLYNFPYVPYGLTTIIFFSFILSRRFLQHLNFVTRFTSTLIWARSIPVPKNKAEVFILLKEVSDRFKIRHVTLIEPREGGNALISINSKHNVGRTWESEELFLEKIPPVFSHVLTTKSALLNIHKDSELALNLAKGGTNKKGPYDSDQYTIVPLKKDGIPISAIALTGYSENLFSNLSIRKEFQLTIEIIFPLISEYLWSSNIFTSDEWFRVCSKTSEQIIRAPKALDETQLLSVMRTVADIVHQNTGFGVFLARVNPITREYDIKATSGFSETVSKMYQETGFYALQENQHGPMPLAINRGEIVTVADLSWLHSVLHPKSLAILKLSECRSGAAIPIYAIGDPRSALTRVWGLMWLEDTKPGTFLPNREQGLRTLSASMESVLAHAEISNRAMEALKGLARPDIAKKLMRKESVREEETGYLLIADIRGSTAIANEEGAERWSTFVEWIRPAITELAIIHGLKLEMIVWDAFFFTVAREQHTTNDVPMFLEFATKMNSLLEIAFRKEFSNRVSEADKTRARFCLEFGDTTRDIRNGNWQIIGAAMAKVCKLESECKSLSGWFFLPDNLVPNESQFSLVTSPITARRVASYKLNAVFTIPDLRMFQILSLSGANEGSHNEAA